MNTASLELCKTLYELSGWEVTLWYQRSYYEAMQDWTEWKITEYESGLKHERVPAYDLGYLLQKLPEAGLNMDTLRIEYFKHIDGERKWYAGFWPVDSEPDTRFANTPEDAACKLAIQLFKAGILTKGAKS